MKTPKKVKYHWYSRPVWVVDIGVDEKNVQQSIAFSEWEHAVIYASLLDIGELIYENKIK